MTILRKLGLPLLLLLVGVGLLQGCVSPGLIGDSTQESTGEMGEVKQGSSAADIYVRLAGEYLKEGNPQAALTNAKKAVEKDPHSSNAHMILAVVYENLGETGLAEKHFKRSLRKDSKNSYALNAYGSMLCGDGKYAEAMQYFDRAVENPLYETPWVALTNAGICARSDGDLVLAETYLRRALEMNGRFNPALLQMARVSFENQRYLQTRAYLERYEGRPTAESLWLGVKSERQLGDFDQARSYELLLRDRFPDSRQVQNLDSER